MSAPKLSALTEQGSNPSTQEVHVSASENRQNHAEGLHPSSLYRANLWRAATAISRRMPHFLLCRFAGHMARLYWLSCPKRRRVVFQNLLPAVRGDVRTARITTRELFQQFGI